MTDASLYACWASMRQRCYNKNSTDYKHWGGRGITMCNRWRNSFTAFIEDMGPKPTQYHSLDRIDNEGNYKPSNCRWATDLQQARNTRAYKGGRTDILHIRIASDLKKLIKAEAKQRHISMADFVAQEMAKAV